MLLFSGLVGERFYAVAAPGKPGGRFRGNMRNYRLGACEIYYIWEMGFSGVVSML